LSAAVGEAEILASLNHPNIAVAIYDLQEANGFRFLILELIEGKRGVEPRWQGSFLLRTLPASPILRTSSTGDTAAAVTRTETTVETSHRALSQA